MKNISKNEERVNFNLRKSTVILHAKKVKTNDTHINKTQQEN